MTEEVDGEVKGRREGSGKRKEEEVRRRRRRSMGKRGGQEGMSTRKLGSLSDEYKDSPLRVGSPLSNRGETPKCGGESQEGVSTRPPETVYSGGLVDRDPVVDSPYRSPNVSRSIGRPDPVRSCEPTNPTYNCSTVKTGGRNDRVPERTCETKISVK